MKYYYDGIVYDNEEEVYKAIEENLAKQVNNSDVPQHMIESEFYSYVDEWVE